MKKTELINFIKKYHLDGTVDSVKIESDGKDLLVKFSSDDKMIIGAVKLNGITLPEAVFGINNTSDLLKILDAHEDEIDLKLNQHKDKFVSVVITDKEINSLYVLADPDVIINKAGTPKNLPAFESTLKLDKTFVEKFLKGNSALTTSNVAISVTGKEIEFVLGYSENNTNRIKLKRELQESADTGLINFNSECLKKIFTVNKDFEEGFLMLSSVGLMKMRFKTEKGISEYYIVPLVKN